MAGLGQLRRKRTKLNAEYRTEKRQLKKQLEKISVSSLDCGQLTALFHSLASVAYEEGVLALEEFVPLICDKEQENLLGAGLKRVVRGDDATVTADVMGKWVKLLLQEQEKRYSMLIEGVGLLHKLQLPAVVRAQLQAHYSLEE